MDEISNGGEIIASLISGNHIKGTWEAGLWDELTIHKTKSRFIKGSQAFFVRIAAAITILSMTYALLLNRLFPEMVDLIGILAIAILSPMALLYGFKALNKNIETYGIVTLIVLFISAIILFSILGVI